MKQFAIRSLRIVSRKFAVPALAVAAMTMVSVGCSPAEQRLAELRMNPSPELMSTGLSQGQIENMIAIEHDKQLRSLNTDILRFWLLIDRHGTSHYMARP